MREAAADILLVEDNDDDLELTLYALRNGDSPATVDVVRDGLEALEYLLDSNDPGRGRALPKLVLLDLKLPLISGAEVLRRLRADPRTRLLPVIILTSSDQHQDVMDGYSFGATSYLVKPVDYDDFRQLIRDVGRCWLHLQAVPGLV